MGLPAKTKEQLEKEILETLAEYHESCGDSMESRRHAIFARLVETVFKWCCEYPFKFFRDKKIEPKEKGLEIWKAVEKCVTIPSAQKEDKGFLGYLVTTIKNAIIKSSTEHDYCEDTIRITRGRLNKQNKIDTALKAIERKLAFNEAVAYIARFFDWTEIKAEKEYKKYLKYKDMGKTDSLEYGTNDDEERDMLNNKKSASPYLRETPDDPKDINFNKLMADQIMKARETVFMKKTDKLKNYLAKIWTINQIKSLIYVEEKFPFIDTTLVEIYRKGNKLPTQYEIYRKYHPKATQKSAESQSSNRLGDFEKEVQLELIRLEMLDWEEDFSKKDQEKLQKFLKKLPKKQ